MFVPPEDHEKDRNAFQGRLYHILRSAYEAGYRSALTREDNHAFGYGFDFWWDAMLEGYDD